MEILASFGIAAAVTLLISVLASVETAEAQAPASALLAPPAERPSALSAFRAFVERWNAGDVEGAVECFGERAIFRGGPLLPEGGCLGRDSIRAFIGHTVATNIHCQMMEGRSSPNGSGGRLEVQSDRIHRRGLARIRLSYYAEVRDGSIVLLHMTADTNDDETAEYSDYIRSLRLTGAEEAIAAVTAPPPVDLADVVEGEVIRTYDAYEALPQQAPAYTDRQRLLFAAILSAVAVISMWLAFRRGGAQPDAEPEPEALLPGDST